MMNRKTYNSHHNVESEDDEEEDEDYDENDNGNDNGDEKSEESDDDHEESPEPQLPDRPWTRRHLADYFFNVRVKDDPFYMRDMRCVGSISHGIKNGNMVCFIFDGLYFLLFSERLKKKTKKKKYSI